MQPCGISVRISDDREGAGLGVERQEKDCRALAEKLGWPVEAVYVDNDLTAFDKSRKYKPRPGYERMVEDVKAGRIRAVIAWHSDRLHRSPRELEDFIDLAEAHDLAVETVKSGIVALGTPAGRAVARTLCAWAYYESEHKSERIKAKYVQLAETGMPGNGGFRPFGYTKDRLEIVPTEAEHLRWAYGQVLAGRSLRSIVADLAERGVLTTQGSRWSQQALRYNLLSPRNAGLREHRRVIVGEAVWPEIVDRETWERAVLLLRDRSRRVDYRDGSAVTNARKHLLTGFLWCGRCGMKLVPRTAGTRPRYGCLPVGDGGCSGSYTMISHTDATVTAAVLLWLEQYADLTPPAHDPTSALLDRIAADEERLRMLAAAFADDPDGNPLELRAAGAKIRNRIAATKAEIADTAVAVRIADPLQVRESWPAYDLQQKRQTIGALIERIDVGPGTGGRFDPERLTITWR